ncbi:hypothetical protein ACFV2X_27315 [Streptomyces sp. NPDC059679]|uniref:hypothetical protein n=1 Tax=Streptomyces sp. NPDC059679 TaxID=3346903 RepID=UPI0036898C9B
MRSPATPVVRAAAQSAAALALLLPAVWCGTAQSASASAAMPSCGRRESPRFPIDARLHGGPARYARGGGWHAWHLELRNTTRVECRAIHPIAILVDRAHALRPDHIRMEFLDPYADKAAGGRWRPVSFETTDEDENIGVFGDPFQGFTVPARGSVKVRVRSHFTDSAPTGPVTANVITMERRADDGDWVGQSGDYDFRIERAAGVGAEEASGAGTGEPEEPRTSGPSARTDEQPGTGGLRTGEPPAEPRPEPRAGQGTGARGRTGSPAGPGKEEAPARADATPGPRGEGSSRDQLPPELAATGRGVVLLGLAVISGALIVSGTALVIRSRRPRR